MIKRVTVYCASSNKIAKKYFDATREIGRILCLHNIHVVFGGGGSGLMGALATSVIEHKGKITGIMPHFMKEVEWQHAGVQDFQFVEDMHERKKRFLIDVDALIALPGGTGTFEELFEAITLKKLGKFTKPIIIFNQDGYYDPILEMLDKCEREQFMGKQHHGLWSVISDPAELITAIEGAEEWGADAISYAKV